MSQYGIILILLPISMAGVLARPHNEHRHHHEESHAKYHKTSKRSDDRIDHVLDYTWEEIDIINYYTPKCDFDVELVPCKGNGCAEQYLKHIKCKPHALTLLDNGEFCLQMYRTVNCTGENPPRPMKLFTGCVLVTHKQMDKMAVDTLS